MRDGRRGCGVATADVFSQGDFDGGADFVGGQFHEQTVRAKRTSEMEKRGGAHSNYDGRPLTPALSPDGGEADATFKCIQR